MGSLLKLKKYIKPHLWLILLSAALAIPYAAVQAIPIKLTQFFIDDVLVKGSTEYFYLIPLTLVGVYTINFPIRFAHYYCNRLAIARINRRIKIDLYRHLLSLSADHFSERRTGELISRIAKDPEYIDGGINALNALIREPLKFLIFLSYVVYVNWKLTILIFIILPILALIFHVTGRNLKRYISRIAEENANVYSSLQETITGFRIIKTFRLEKYSEKKFKSGVNEYTKFYLKTSALEEAAHPLVEVLTAIALSSVLYFGGVGVLQGEMTQGAFLSFLFALGLMMDPIRKINEAYMKLNQGSAACDRVLDVFSWKSKILETETPIRKKDFTTSLDIQNISFHYPDAPEKKVLKNVSFSVPRNSVVALVGASGAGKSSLISLIPRIYDVTMGKILIDSVDIKDLSLSDLRNLISVVSQEVFLFNDTLRENIRCGRLNATDQEIERAADLAHVTEYLDKLEHGLDTKIGDRGQKLSGGQRQRLSIARAFLREAPILILDEATSNLDHASEKIVQDAMQTLMANRTTIVIAHRLSTIQNADKILVLKSGQIVETGDHKELIRLDGEYANLQRVGELP